MAEFDLKKMEEDIRKRLHPTRSPIQKLREVAKIRKPKSPRLPRR